MHIYHIEPTVKNGKCHCIIVAVVCSSTSFIVNVIILLIVTELMRILNGRNLVVVRKVSLLHNCFLNRPVAI